MPFGRMWRADDDALNSAFRLEFPGAAVQLENKPVWVLEIPNTRRLCATIRQVLARRQALNASPIISVHVSGKLLAKHIDCVASLSPTYLGVDDSSPSVLRKVMERISPRGMSVPARLISEVAHSVSELYITEPMPPDTIPLLTGIESLYLVSGTGGVKLDSLGKLSTLGNLRSLGLWNSNVQDISVLSTYRQLEYLSLGNTRVSDLAPLTSMSNLRELRFTSTRLSNIEPLAKLSSLEVLDLGRNSVTDLSPLSELTQLRVLLLAGTEADLSPLAGLENLSRLELAHGTSDLSPLGGLSGLRILGLGRSSVSDFGILADLTCLRMLNLSSTSIDLSVLDPLDHLEVLDLSVLDSDPDLTKLTELDRLQELRIFGNRDWKWASRTLKERMPNLRIVDTKGCRDIPAIDDLYPPECGRYPWPL